MAVKVYKRNNAGRRNMSIVKPDNLTDAKPLKSLSKVFKRAKGRAGGTITTRHKGGGNKRKYRMIDFKMKKLGIPAKVVSIEKDPNRSALIALICYADGEKSYILATEGMKKDQTIIFDEKTPIEKGNRLKLKNIPVGTAVCNVEMKVGKGGQMARSAGSAVVVQAIESGMAHLKMSSTEVRMVPADCFATIGQASNFEHSSYRVGKAGRKRHMGIRPTVRGSAMNPVDHPHGGGEGRQPIGLKYPKTPWGRPALGVKTRKKKKASDRLIIRRRQKKRRK